MAVYKVLAYPHVLLRKKCTPVNSFNNDLNLFVSDMVDTMNAMDGIGLAASQLGILKNIIVVNIQAYLDNPEMKDWHGEITYKVAGQQQPLLFPLKLVNPTIVSEKDEISFPFDGCLSLPGVSKAQTTRKKWIELHAKLPDGTDISIECNGIMSICLQHELDHLQGVLFIDHLQEKMTDKDVILDIQDFQEDPKERRRQKKLKALDARKMTYQIS